VGIGERVSSHMTSCLHRIVDRAAGLARRHRAARAAGASREGNIPSPVPVNSRNGPLLFATYSGVPGGAEQTLLDLLTGLDEPAVLLCPRGSLASRSAAAGIPVLIRPARPLEVRGGPRARLGAVARLAAHAREVRSVTTSLQPRTVVAWGMRSAIACAAALRLLRSPPPLVFQHLNFLPTPGVAWAVRAAARASERVIVASAAIAADLDRSNRLGSRVCVASPGVDVDRFAASDPPPGPPVALMLGAIVPLKRPDLALEAVALASRELPALRLVVAGHPVGEGSERLLALLRRRAARPDLEGRVQLRPELADPRAALESSSCLLHCADREAFGLVLLEAMAAGRPVVAPASGGPLEIVADGCGRLFPPGDAHAAGRALAELLRDREELRRAGERSRARAVECFDLASARRRWREAAAPGLGGAGRSRRTGAELTLVTVSHDSEPELERLLRSVERHLPSAAVVVVDSGSSDDSAEVARRRPAVRTVIELDNVGYGRAANAGVARVETPACVVLNPDVELVDDSLGHLAAEAVRPGTSERLLAPLVLRADGERQDSVHAEPVSAQAAVTALLPPALLPPVLRRWLQPWRDHRPRAVAWVVGCCVGARTDTLRRLGPFDRRIFLYGEDLELGLRARDAEIETWWWPHARVIHHESHSARRVFGAEPYELIARQRRAVIEERRGRRAAGWNDRLELVTLANRIALKTALGRATVRERRRLAALRAARRGEATLGAP
jgi:N-acetylglucosaminyl-diphospho-decaprenol L-rhamnosyltransferase